MSASRQQRRARERAQRKAAGRPSGRAESPGRQQAPRRAMTVQVDLSRTVQVTVEMYGSEALVEYDDPYREVWSAQWGLRGSSVGYEDSAVDLQELVQKVVERTRSHWGQTYDLHLEWAVSGDHLHGQSPQRAITAAGVSLPDRPTVIPPSAPQPDLQVWAVANIEIDRDAEDGTWIAEFGIRGEDWGGTPEDPDPARLVAGIIDELEEIRDDRELWLAWFVLGDQLEGQTPREALTAAGIDLPTVLGRKSQ